MCPYSHCAAAFTDLTLYTEHMSLHTQEKSPEELRKERWYNEGYVGQYESSIAVACAQGRLTEARMAKMVEFPSSNFHVFSYFFFFSFCVYFILLLCSFVHFNKLHDMKKFNKEDIETRTKGLIDLIKAQTRSSSKIHLSSGCSHYFTSFGDSGWGCGMCFFSVFLVFLSEEGIGMRK